MNRQKEKELEKAFERIINVGFCIMPYQDLSNIIDPDLMLFGTAKDELKFSFPELDAMFKSQYEQMEGFQPSLDRKRLLTRISNDGNHACIAEELTLTIASPEKVDTIPIRASCVMEYMDSRWKLVHWHASSPVDTENDHWHKEEWQREKENLEKQVAERTADLQVKNRELEIEAATQRVRAVAMGMQEPGDIMNVLNVMKEEIDTFELGNIATWIWTKDQDGIITQWDISEVIKEGNLVNFNLTFDIYDTEKNPEVNRHTKEWEKGKKYYTLNWRGQKLQEVVDEVATIDPESGKMFQEAVDVGQIENYWHAASPFFQGVVGLDFTSAPPEITEPILLKMSSAFEMAYRRFEDLKKSEHQAYESKVESSLERVRGMAAAMNHSDDLMQIAEAMFREMEILKINPLRYGIGMIDGEKKEAELWASTVDDGHYLDMLGTLSLTWHPMLEKVLDAWDAQHEELIYELKGKELSDYYQKIGQVNPDIPNLRELQDPKNEISQYVSFFPFKSGALYAFTDGSPGEEGRSILKRFANVFEQAHIRYNDLQKAENQARLIREERDRLEIALKELKATQEQLVQQEKLASLGQLTAGIAHEIKNPLNFVNNFSDLSVELVKEAREEVRRGTEDGGRKNSLRQPAESAEAERRRGVSGRANDNDQPQNSDDDSSSSNTPLNPLSRVDLILDILDDIEANLNTIHKHGSRADGIVKSMLEHSRGGSGKMEPTNLNALIKEFVNLSFHGMRASKNPINVDMELDLDESIGDIPLIAEDFSRVIINLCNNAFDAMREKGSDKDLTGFENLSGLEDYQPKLTVRTNSSSSTITIEIEDNGPGIPGEMKDKVMQPFYTTKKGTQGTGLGLSITNDIVKAHGGTLNVQSKPEQTVFSIQLNR